MMVPNQVRTYYLFIITPAAQGRKNQTTVIVGSVIHSKVAKGPINRSPRSNREVMAV
jgi:hypothetical protein